MTENALFSAKDLVSKAERAVMLKTELWNIANQLRGTMDASEYQKYILGIICYRYLSDSVVKSTYRNVATEDENQTLSEIWNNEDYLEDDDLENEIRNELGYFIPVELLFDTMIAEIRDPSQGWSIDKLLEGFRAVQDSAIGTEAEDDFKGLFDSIDLHAHSLGITPKDRTQKIAKIMLSINNIDLTGDDDILGDAYEYLIGQFASSAGKKGGEFYTPQTVARICSQILIQNNPNMKNVYDPTCGSGSMLLRIVRELGKKIEDDKGEQAAEDKVNSIKIYGQELNTTTYNLSRMNMILHDVSFRNYSLYNGNTLTNDGFPDEKFDGIAANPPYSANWDHSDTVREDPRFASVAKLAPTSKADLAFVQHMAYHLTDNGSAAIVLPHGPMFRGGSEKDIRTWLVQQNLVHAVIGLPDNLFYGTTIPTCILVLKKNRKRDDKVLFVDASKKFTKAKNKNELSDDDVKTILDTYEKFEEKEGYSVTVSKNDIVDKDYDLYVSRYVDSSEKEAQLDLDEIQLTIQSRIEEISNLTAKIDELKAKLHPYEV